MSIAVASAQAPPQWTGGTFGNPVIHVPGAGHLAGRLAGGGEVDPVMPAPPWPPRPTPPEPVRDDFDSPALHPRWISIRSRPAEPFSLAARPGWLTLRASAGTSLDDPDVVFAGRRQQHASCHLRALIDTSEGVGGLDERHHYDIEAGAVRVRARIGSVRATVATRALPAGPVVLRIDTVAAPAGGWHPCAEPDTVRLDVEGPDGAVDVLAELDGRYLSTEVAGGFTGRVIGVYAATGTVHADWIDYAPDDAR